MHENQSPVPLPRYRCHKVVEAAKIDSVTFTLVDYGVPDAERQTSHWLHLAGVKDPLPVTAEWYDRHKVQPGGYFVRYADGYTSFSLAEAFEAGYSKLADAKSTLADITVRIDDEAKEWLGKVEELVASLSKERVSDDAVAELVAEREELRKECADLRQALAASPQAFDALLKADLHHYLHEAAGKIARRQTKEFEHRSRLLDAIAQLSCCLPAEDVDFSDPVSVAKKVIALIQKLRNENAELAQAQAVKASAKSMAEQIDNELIAEVKARAPCAYDSWSDADDACRAAAVHVAQRLIDQRRYRHGKRGDVRRCREAAVDLSSMTEHDPVQLMRDCIEPLADCIHNDLVDSGEPFEFVMLPSHEPIGDDQHDPLAAHVVAEDGYCVRARVARDSRGKTRMVIDWAGY